MKIGIFETEHFEGAYPVIRLFNLPGNSLFIFTNESTFAKFKDLFGESAADFTWIVLPDNLNRFAFVRRNFKAAKNHQLDLMYFNTISNNHILYALFMRSLKNVRTVMTVHDINCFFNQKAISFREIVQKIGKRGLAKRLTDYNVVSDTMIPYLTSFVKGKPIHNIPGAVYENRETAVNVGTNLHLVVPGSIDPKRRNYEEVFDLVNLAEGASVSLRITMLGGFFSEYGEKIIERAKTLKLRFVQLNYFEDSFVSQERFDHFMDACHFVYIPSVVETFICGQTPEVYGTTKSSGNIFDVIKHAKPFICPGRLRVPADLESSCVRYQQVEEIIQFAQKLLASPDDYTRLQQNALANSNHYTAEKIRERNRSLFAGGR